MHEGRRRKSFELLNKGTPLLFRADRLHLVRGHGRKKKNFITLLDLINASEAREDNLKLSLARWTCSFSTGERAGPLAVKQYRKFKMAAGKDTKSILISAAPGACSLRHQGARTWMEYDELNLDTPELKTALFVILSDTDSTFTSASRV